MKIVYNILYIWLIIKPLKIRDIFIIIVVKQTTAFKNWLNSLTKKEYVQVNARLERLSEFGHFGDSKSLGEHLYELRWKNGWRVYFTMNGNTCILLAGGHKNEQEKNIKKARLDLGRLFFDANA